MKNIFFLLLVTITTTLSAQVRFTSTANTAVATGSSFLDASSNSTNNSSTSIGKGLVFPRVTLSTFTFGSAATGIGNAYPSRYDGMIVYNTSTSGTVPVAGGLTQGTLTEGFWYYENKSSTLTGGTWKPLGGLSASVKSKTVTATATGTSVTLDLGTTIITASEVNTFLGAKIYDASGNLVMTADSEYAKTTNILTTGNGFIAQALPAATYTVVVEYK